MVILFFDPQTRITQTWNISNRYIDDMNVVLRQYRRLSAARLVKAEWLQEGKIKYSKKSQSYYLPKSEKAIKEEYENTILKRMECLLLKKY